MRRNILGWIAGAVAAAVILAAPTAYAFPALDPGWRDKHTGYPAVPNGEAAIVKTFGAACNSAVNDNNVLLKAADNGKWYQVNFHKRLGGASSSNLDNDIVGHIYASGYDKELKSGIWGYNCRRKRNSNAWSAHAWGIAVDINSAYEYQGDTNCNTVTTWMGKVWTDHRWTWGRAFKDCMHFQYATGY
jgi:D-alanyl-D-alanine carboxypeptidase-like protein